MKANSQLRPPQSKKTEYHPSSKSQLIGSQLHDPGQIDAIEGQTKTAELAVLHVHHMVYEQQQAVEEVLVALPHLDLPLPREQHPAVGRVQLMGKNNKI